MRTVWVWELLKKHRILLVALLLILLVSLLVCSSIILTDGTVLYGDFSFVYDLGNFGTASMWNEHGQETNLGCANRILPFGPLVMSAGFLGVPSDVLYKLLIVGTLFLAGSSMFVAASWLGRRVFPSVGPSTLFLGSLVAGLVFMLNPWSVNRIEHYFLWFGYALSPLVLMFAFIALERSSLRAAAVAGLLWAIGSTSVHYTVFLGLLLICTYAFMLASQRGRDWKALTLPFVAIVGIFLVASAYWVIPYAQTILQGTTSPTTVLTVEVLELLSRNSSPDNSVRLIGYFWPHIEITPNVWGGTVWLISGFMLPLLAYLAPFLRRHPYVIFFALMSVVFTILSFGTSGPIGQLYVWLCFEAPLSSSFGWLIRDPDKWGGIVALFYSLLLVITFIGLSERLLSFLGRADIRRNVAVGLLVFVVMMVPFAVFASPIVIDQMSSTYNPVKVPSEYIDVNEWMAQGSGDVAMMWVPQTGGESTDWTDHPISMMDSLYGKVPSFGSFNIISANYLDFLTYVLEGNRTADAGKLVSIAGAKYLVVPHDVPALRSKAEMVTSSLRDQENLSIALDNGVLTVYQLDGEIDRAYASGMGYISFGGLDDLLSLTSLSDYQPTSFPVLFVSQGDYESLPAGPLVSSNIQIEDFLMVDPTSTLIAPYDHTDHHRPESMWSKGSTSEPLHGEWRRYIEGIGIDNWELDYGEGLAFTWSGPIHEDNTIRVPLSVEANGEYFLSVRHFISSAGGVMEMLLDGESVTIMDSSSEIDRFQWDTIGPLNLTSGTHELAFRNINGLNALNVIAVTSSQEWLGLADKASSLLGDRDILYLFEGERDFAALGGKMTVGNGSLSRGEALILGDRDEASSGFEVLVDGDYSLYLRLDGEGTCSVDGYETILGPRQGLTYVGTYHLSAGEHTLTIAGGNGHLALDAAYLRKASAEGPLLPKAASEEPKVTNVVHASPTKVEVTVNASVPFYLTVGKAYDRGWVAIVDGKVYRSLPGFSFLNTFRIEETGDLTVEIIYEPQNWLETGFVVSTVGSLILIPSLVIIDRRRTRERSHIGTPTSRRAT